MARRERLRPDIVLEIVRFRSCLALRQLAEKADTLSSLVETPWLGDVTAKDDMIRAA